MNNEVRTVMFTVIINNYNYGWCLQEAVDSIIAQTNRDFELIIVDDGSTDNSLEIIKSITFPLKLVRSPGLEQARACLLALSHASGRYVYFLDADDIAEPRLLAEAAEHVGTNPSKIQFRMQPVDRTGSPIHKPFPDVPQRYGSKEMKEDIIKYGYSISPPTSGNIFRVDVLKKVGDIAYDRAIDGITLLVAPFCGEVVCLRIVLAKYRIHTGGHSAHSRPSDVKTIDRDRLRFVARLEHLRRLLSNSHLGQGLPRSGPEYLFYTDQATLRAALLETRCSFETLFRFVYLLLRERGFTVYTFRKLIWLATIIIAPRAVAARIAIKRRTPWGLSDIAF